MTALTTEQVDELRKRVRRGRGVPWVSMLLFLVCLAVLIAWAVSPQVQAFVDDDGELGKAVIAAALLGGCVLFTALALFPFRLPSIRRAGRLAERDPDDLVMVGATEPTLRTALRYLAQADNAKTAGFFTWFCATVSKTGIALWRSRDDSAPSYSWGWDRISVVRRSATGASASFPALAVVVTVGTEPVEVPLVVVGRGPAGAFAQTRATIDLLVDYCGELSPRLRETTS
jgi:hypothetical protein